MIGREGQARDTYTKKKRIGSQDLGNKIKKKASLYLIKGVRSSKLTCAGQSVVTAAKRKSGDKLPAIY